MKRPRANRLVGACAAVLATATLVVALASPAQAAFQITYETIDLTDSVPGEDLWQYDYVVSGHDFEEWEFFEVLFPGGFYTGLSIAAAAPGWDVLVFGDDPIFPDAGFAATALGPISGPQNFSISFVWLGEPEATPGSQQFTLYGADAGITATGFTTEATDIEVVPEPTSALLLAAGLLTAGALARRGRRRQVPSPCA
jgi:hypothetical protein